MTIEQIKSTLKTRLNATEKELECLDVFKKLKDSTIEKEITRVKQKYIDIHYCLYLLETLDDGEQK